VKLLISLSRLYFPSIGRSTVFPATRSLAAAWACSAGTRRATSKKLARMSGRDGYASLAIIFATCTSSLAMLLLVIGLPLAHSYCGCGTCSMYLSAGMVTGITRPCSFASRSSSLMRCITKALEIAGSLAK